MSSNNLERRIIVVDGTSEILKMISEFGGDVTSVRHDALDTLTKKDIDLGDAILLNEVSMSDLPTKSPARVMLKKVLDLYHNDARPIAAIGQSLLLIAELLSGRSLEVAFEKGASLEKHREALEKTGALLTACPADDFISDRLNKTLTTLGSLASHGADSAQIGIQRLLRELVEMA